MPSNPVFPATLALLALIFANANARAAGEPKVGAQLFAQRCARCHGKGGKGDGPDLAKLHLDSRPDDFTDKTLNAELSDYKIIKIVTEGGKAVDKSPKMPAFGSKLSPVQIQDLMAFIRTLAK